MDELLVLPGRPDYKALRAVVIQMLRTMAQESLDVYALDLLQTGWDMDVTQLAQTNMTSSARLIQSDRVSLVPMVLNANFNLTVLAKPGYINFGLPALDSTPIWVGDHAVTADELVLFPSGEQGTSVSRAGCSAMAIHLQQSQLEEILKVVFHRTLGDMLSHTGANPLLARDQVALLQELNAWKYLARNKHQATDSLMQQREETLVESILSYLFRSENENEGSRKSLKSERAMNTALEFIHDNPLDGVTITKLCEVTDCSISALEYSFSKRFGVTPKRYIKGLQLSRVRKALSLISEKGSRSITDLATQHGFWHMGQFAADYRKLFGELPSETVTKSCS